MGSSGKAVKLTTSGGQTIVTPINESPEAKAQAEGETPQAGEDSTLIKSPSNDENDLEGVTTLSYKGEDKWFNNPKLSNHAEWYNNLTSDQKDAIFYYTGSSYKKLNPALYDTPWDKMDSYQKKKASDLFNAINGFELNKSINLLRNCDFQIFGLPQHKSLSASQLKDLLANQQDFQTNGFLSFTSDTDHGTYSHNSGLVIHFVMPPNKGGGAWLGTKFNSNEREFLLNSNAVLHFDPNSVHTEDGYVHVNAVWVGQAADQVFNKKKG